MFCESFCVEEMVSKLNITNTKTRIIMAKIIRRKDDFTFLEILDVYLI
jgi:hypothetical protein